MANRSKIPVDGFNQLIKYDETEWKKFPEPTEEDIVCVYKKTMGESLDSKDSKDSKKPKYNKHAIAFAYGLQEYGLTGREVMKEWKFGRPS